MITKITYYNKDDLDLKVLNRFLGYYKRPLPKKLQLLNERIRFCYGIDYDLIIRELPTKYNYNWSTKDYCMFECDFSKDTDYKLRRKYGHNNLGCRTVNQMYKIVSEVFLCDCIAEERERKIKMILE
jgi:hypothetical protein